MGALRKQFTKPTLRGILSRSTAQGLAKRRSPGLVNFFHALGCHFFLALPAAFTQSGDNLLAEPCTYTDWDELIHPAVTRVENKTSKAK